MRKKLAFRITFVFGLSSLGLGSAAAQAPPAHAPDGGTRQRLESIAIPPATNAPFSATVVTEWTRILPDGSTMTNKNHRIVARDSSGRIFQERRFFSPSGDKQVTPLSELDYQDPNRHQMYVCRPDQHVCTLYQYDAPATVALSKPGLQPGGSSNVTREDLGRKTIDALDLVGSREITTISAGAIGNQQPEPIVKEFWYSPHLGINVITKRFDPRSSAMQNFELTNINLSEPDPKLFQPPADYRVIRMDGQ